MVCCLLVPGLAEASIQVGRLAQQELKTINLSWRSEGYVEEYNIQVLCHHHGVGKVQTCNDRQLDAILVSLPAFLILKVILTGLPG